MVVLPIAVLSAVCLLSIGADENGENCTYAGKIYKDGDTVTDNCVICECVNGQLKDCLFAINCSVTVDKKAPAIQDNINYTDEPDVFGSSDNTALKHQNHSKDLFEVKVKTNASVQIKETVNLGIQGGVGVNVSEINKLQEEPRKISEKKKESSGPIKIGDKFGHEPKRKEEHGRIDIRIMGGNKKSVEEINLERGKVVIKLGGPVGHEQGRKEERGKIAIKIKEENKKSSPQNSKENKGTIKPGEKIVHEHERKEEHAMIGIKIKEESKESFREHSTKGNGGKFAHEYGFKEEHKKIDIKIKDESKYSYGKDIIKENKGKPKPKKPVNHPKPITPAKPVKPVPTVGESCTFDKDFVPDGKTVKFDCVTCTCNDGALTCVKNQNCQGVCSVTSFQMIRTFDGTLYEAPGGCNYILVKTPAFTISLSNKLCSELYGNIYDQDAVCIESVEIYIPSKVNIKLRYDGTILSAGATTVLPFSILDTITVLRSSSTFLDVASPLFNLQYDLNLNRLYVILDASYKGKTKGLCGTYNDNRNDDFTSSNDITETVPTFFIDSWKTDSKCSEHEKGSEDKDKTVNADLTCSVALESSIFEDCALLIDIHSYKISCANSVYNIKEIGLCTALADYAYRCARAGIFVAVSSTFSDCTPVCEGDMIFITEDTFSQEDCAEFSTELLKITSSIPLNEACICPPDLYYDASLNTCVRGDSCPCYNNNHLYKIGEIITQSNGQTCPCERLLQCGNTEQTTLTEIEKCPENEVYSDCLVGSGKSCELSCKNFALFDQGCILECKPGCVCKSGLLRSGDGSCLPLNKCPCTHGNEIYNPGETLARDCNTCTCENGKFSCTNNPCNKVCNAYAGSQFFLFDNLWKTFATKECSVVLTESRKGESPNFRVVMQNTLHEAMGRALLKKTIHITFGGASVVLSEFETTVTHELNSRTQLRTYQAGFYVVAHFLEGLAVYYDQHLDVIIQLEPMLQGKVQGMCGDADGTTTTEMTISNMVQYASQFLVGECPNHISTLPPPTDNHKKFVETRCKLLKSDEFFQCHTVVNVEPYYTACVEETEACREGEACLCYCTALAAYARACCRKGITIEWRSPDTCPSPCEYYNRDAGEGPYRLVMMNSQTLVADYDSETVSLENVNAPGNLKASFMITPSLYVDKQNGRKLISLESAQHHNFFIAQNDEGSLSLKKWQPSVEFRKKATFVLRQSRWVKDFNALESFLARGHYLSKSGEKLIISKVKSVNIQQMSFQLIEESFGLPSYSSCTWKYRACESSCIPTCQDPLGTECTLTLKVEGCYPLCAPGMVFDEVTHRCVRFEDCITPSVKPTETPATSYEPCKNVKCKVEPCAYGEYLQEVPSTGSCCPQYECHSLTTLPPSTTTMPGCQSVKCAVDSCGDGEYLQQISTTDPCCPHFVCIGITTPIPKVTTEEMCKHATCAMKECRNDQYLQQVPTSDFCCPHYECIDLSTTPSIPETTTPSYNACENVVCPTSACDKEGANTIMGLEGACCAICVCDPCPPAPYCNGNKPIMKIDPEKECCPRYECPLETSPLTTTEILTTSPTVPPTTPQPCDKVTCITVQCRDGEKLIVKKNPNDTCCPLYECLPPPTSSPSPKTATQNFCDTSACPVLDCFKEGSIKEFVGGNDPCCPAFRCVCQPCNPVLDCGEFSPIVDFHKEKECCPRYHCPTASPQIKQTTPIITTPEPCKDVLCEPPVICTKNGAILIEIPWADVCCLHYECQCQETCEPLPTCSDSSPPLRIGDPDVDCCPKYECPVPPSTTAPPTKSECAGVTCPATVCGGNDILVEVLAENPCCKKFDCVPPVVSTTTMKPCDINACSVANCTPGDKVLVRPNPDDLCCPVYECVPTTTSPPPVWTTTPYACENVVCPTSACDKEGANTIMGLEGACCAICVCDPCPPAPYCNGNKPIMKIDPEKECCPRYECLPTTTSPPPVWTTTAYEPCKDVLCEPPVICTKNGAILVEIPWADVCCLHYECQCQETCEPLPTCSDSSPPLRIGDPDVDCCPKYECPVAPSTTAPPTKSECAGVTCPATVCGGNDILVEVLAENPCCKKFDCVPPVVSTTTIKPCDINACSVANCTPGDKVLVRPNPDDLCCPVYECVPPTTTSAPPVWTTTAYEPCKDVLCEPPVICTKNGAILVEIPWADVCCLHYECQCQETCEPLPTCSDSSPPLRIGDPNVDCCPKYECPVPPSTTAPPTKSECAGVTCPATVCGGNDILVEVLAENPCCKKFDCVPPVVSTTTMKPCDINACSVANCTPGDKVLVRQNPDDLCCPVYECVPTTTSPPPVWTTTPYACENVVCPTSACDKEGASTIMGLEGACCAICVCDPCPPAPYCNGNKPIMKIDPEKECCPRYECLPPTTTSPPPVWTTTAYEPCKDVLCEPPVICTKNGAILVEIPWADVCCLHYECQCQETCEPLPTCSDSSPPLRIGDPDVDCCPKYECPVPPSTTAPPTKSECAGVTCPATVCGGNDILVEVLAENPCCKKFDCVPPVVSTTTIKPCDINACSVANCTPGDKVLVRPNPDDLCCPVYECVPTTTSPPPVWTTTAYACENVVCPTSACDKEGANTIMGLEGACCAICVCDPCPPAPYCNGNKPIMKIDPEKECCPRYECLPPTTTSPPPVWTTTPYEPCKDVLCEPPVICTKNGAMLVEIPWADVCCLHYECQCQETCEPLPTCSDSSPPLRIGDPDVDCCPKYECPVPPSTTAPPTKSECAGVTCPATVCGGNDILVEVLAENPCCKKFDCVPPVVSTTTIKPCDINACSVANCTPGDKVLVRPNPDDLCCPVYECVPTTTSPPPVWTTTPYACENVVCPTSACDKEGASTIMGLEGACCAICVCDPCPPAPYCNGNKPVMKIDPEKECCPRYECLPPTTTSPPPVWTTTAYEPCKDVLCEPPVICTKNGAILVEIPWADVCCLHYECQCQETCEPLPTCNDSSPPLRIGDPDVECCPKYECPVAPSTTAPPTKSECAGVTCPATVCGGNDILVEVLAENPCCKKFDCVPPIVSTTTMKPCDINACSVANCTPGDKVLVRPNPDDLCCPVYECVPTTTSPPPVWTTTPYACENVVCPTSACDKEGASTIMGLEGSCCAICVCDPCPPAPYCNGNKPVMKIDPEKECCPRYECPNEAAPPTTTPFTTSPATTPNPCKNVLCEPLACTKKGATVETSYWANQCCPHYACECRDPCSPIPVCEDGSPPFTTQDLESYCCPEYECRIPTTPATIPTTKGACQGVSCAFANCEAGFTLVEVPGDDQCCKSFVCIPPATTLPPTTVKLCDESKCAVANCGEGTTVIVKSNPDDECCPIYECRVITTPAPVSTTPFDECKNIVCKVEECTKQGEIQMFVGWENQCCRDYECWCQPCNPPPYCDGEIPIMNINPDTECCPTYECPAPTTPHTEPVTTIISSTSRNPCEDRVCPRKVCKDYEKLVTQINPSDPCCPILSCECTCNTIPSCASDERLVAVPQSNQCCPKLKCEKKKDECYIVPTQVNITSGKCSANVILTTCSGYCYSKTSYSSFWVPVSQYRCCSVTETSPKTFELPCPDGTKIRQTVQEAKQCGCNRCSKDHGGGSGSGSEKEGSGFAMWSPFDIRN
ncbi:otogelin-like isoform X6 [Eleutherodactylus coqui]|uniref:otogelin-like isoform X6 n=1 Tax=Eleutherodactylus coqui TaxID=57060 RepID=UPI003461BE44